MDDRIEKNTKKLYAYVNKKYHCYLWFIKLRDYNNMLENLSGNTKATMSTIGLKSKYNRIKRRAIYFQVDADDYLDNLKKAADKLYEIMKSKNIKPEILYEGCLPKPNLLYEYKRIDKK